MKQTIRLTESDIRRMVMEVIQNISNTSETENIYGFNRKLPEIIEFLEELANRLDGRTPLLRVNSFEGGNKMFAVSSIRTCVGYLKQMVNNLYPTDNERVIDSY